MVTARLLNGSTTGPAPRYPSAMVTPRLLRPDEAPAYCTLRREMLRDAPHAFLVEDSNPDEVATRMGPGNVLIVVDHPDDPTRIAAVAGMNRLEDPRMSHRARIWSVYCDPAHRRKGYARAVMQAAIEIARMWRGVEVVCLAVSTNSPAALALYESLGFERWGVEPDVVRIGGASYDEIHMAMRL